MTEENTTPLDVPQGATQGAPDLLTFMTAFLIAAVLGLAFVFLFAQERSRVNLYTQIPAEASLAPAGREITLTDREAREIFGTLRAAGCGTVRSVRYDGDFVSAVDGRRIGYIFLVTTNLGNRYRLYLSYEKIAARVDRVRQS